MTIIVGLSMLSDHPTFLNTSGANTKDISFIIAIKLTSIEALLQFSNYRLRLSSVWCLRCYLKAPQL